jgi:hypothetical protein
LGPQARLAVIPTFYFRLLFLFFVCSCFLLSTLTLFTYFHQIAFMFVLFHSFYLLFSMYFFNNLTVRQFIRTFTRPFIHLFIHSFVFSCFFRFSFFLFLLRNTLFPLSYVRFLSINCIFLALTWKSLQISAALNHSRTTM